jgi:DNA-binding NarL/FixJ family response regulator
MPRSLGVCCNASGRPGQEPAAIDEQDRQLVRVLVVDDYAPFRNFVCSMLGRMPGLKIAGEAGDGLEAVEKAKEIQPDLVLMDIGLPSLNGIEAARAIRQLDPQCQIVFLSLESSADVVQEAFDLGALSYIVKQHIGSELASVVETVILGRMLARKNISKAEITS